MAKKLVALLLAVAMVMSFALVAHAEDELVDGKFTTTRHITVEVYDRGNVQQVAVADSPTLSAADVQELRGTLATLSTVLSAMQQKGIPAYINPYGRNGGVSQLGKAESFLAQNRR